MYRKLLAIYILLLLPLAPYSAARAADTNLRQRAYDAAILGADYLKRAVGSEGRMVYSYDAAQNRDYPGYNILRHAGSVYGMLEVYEVSRDDELRPPIERALSYLVQQIKPCESAGKQYSCVVEDGYVKLGGNALAALAFSKYEQVTQSRAFAPLMLQLTEWIVSTQAADGSFSAHKRAHPGGQDSGFVSQYYPGEAIYALMRVNAVAPSSRWTEAAARAADYLIDIRDKDKALDQLPHDHWLLYGLGELQRLSPNTKYREHSRKILEAIFAAQHQAPAITDWRGGFYVPPGSTPTATRSEGMVAAYRVFRTIAEEKEFAQRIMRALEMALEFQLRTQISAERARSLPNPGRALGGFRRDLRSFEVRNDYVQHNISALIGYYSVTGPDPHTSMAAAAARTGRCSERLTREVVDEGIKLGIDFLIESQTPLGNFLYEYDWIAGQRTPGDSEVRQAGAVWGAALLYRETGDARLKPVVEKGFDFFLKNSKTASDGSRYIVYPRELLIAPSNQGSLGTVALLTLGYIEYLNSKPITAGAEYKRRAEELDSYLKFLVLARKDSGLWHANYQLSDGKPLGPSSPYFDGETMLALVKAAKFLDRADLRRIVSEAAPIAHERYVKQALRRVPDSPLTKGFYQWGSMVFYELATSGWSDTTRYGDYVIALADWMIDVHRTLERPKNTAYAYEGIVHAYKIAALREDKAHTEKYGCTIEKGLEKLSSWQIGNPLVNDYIKGYWSEDRLGRGGVQNAKDEPLLRIDVTQHQMHALLLARKYYFDVKQQ